MNLKFGIIYKTGEGKEESNVNVDEYTGHYLHRGAWVKASTSFPYCEMTEYSFDLASPNSQLWKQKI